MRLEKLEDKTLIWETGSQKNNICYDSTIPIVNYRRRELASFQALLKKNNEITEVTKIANHLGKIIRANNIPELIPTGSYWINSHLEFLKDTIDRYVKEYGLNLNPDFQRHHVWTMEQRIRYVEFTLQGGKSSPIYFNHENWMGSGEGEMVVVDGKQRLTSLLMFLNNEFQVLKELDTEGFGFYAREFDFIPNDIIIVINDLPTREKVLQWYLQINKGNVAHTIEEIEKVEDMLRELKGE